MISISNLVFAEKVSRSGFNKDDCSIQYVDDGEIKMLDLGDPSSSEPNACNVCFEDPGNTADPRAIHGAGKPNKDLLYDLCFGNSDDDVDDLLEDSEVESLKDGEIISMGTNNCATGSDKYYAKQDACGTVTRKDGDCKFEKDSSCGCIDDMHYQLNDATNSDTYRRCLGSTSNVANCEETKSCVWPTDCTPGETYYQVCTQCGIESFGIESRVCGETNPNDGVVPDTCNIYINSEGNCRYLRYNEEEKTCEPEPADASNCEDIPPQTCLPDYRRKGINTATCEKLEENCVWVDEPDLNKCFTYVDDGSSKVCSENADFHDSLAQALGRCKNQCKDTSARLSHDGKICYIKNPDTSCIEEDFSPCACKGLIEERTDEDRCNLEYYQFCGEFGCAKKTECLTGYHRKEFNDRSCGGWKFDSYLGECEFSEEGTPLLHCKNIP